jgi:hypothetical protein
VRKKLLIILVLAVLAYIVRVSSIAVAPDQAKAPPHQGDHFDYSGVIHFHTMYTGDAKGTYEEITALANRQHVDFLISTERNNMQALADHKEGWYGNVLTLVGVEMTRPEGYLLGLDLKSYPITREMPTAQVLDVIRGQGGMVFIAHPENPRWRWKYKEDPDIAGLEILDLTDQLNTASLAGMAAWLVDYPINTPYAYLQMYHYPAETLRRWDDVIRKRGYVGIFAPDFHQRVNLWGDHYLLFPKAEDMLPLAHDHIVTPKPFAHLFAQDKAAIYGAIKAGHVYVAMDSMRDATGFFFSAQQNGKAAWLGDTLKAGQAAYFNVVVPGEDKIPGLKICVYRDGEMIHSFATPAAHFEESIKGAYRVEVDADLPTFWGSRSVAWIYSNPIYLR